MSKKMDRRDFVKSIAASGTVAITAWPQLATASPASPAPAATYKVLTSTQAATIGAIADQLVPADDFPSGKDAGVVQFIDDTLAGPYGRFYIDRYEAGLKLVDEMSQKYGGGGFASLGSEQQKAILSTLEKDSSGGEFFRLILSQTFEGYYGDPAHGANRGGASWKMIGFRG